MKNKKSIRENYIVILAHWERRLRLGSGLILVAFVVPHLTNHALGIFSFEAMEALRDWLALVWRSTAGTILLYGAMVSHFALALYSLFRRTTLRMPAWEATQLILGLAIIPLLAFHAIFNRMVWELTTTEVDYQLVIATIWYKDFETWRIIVSAGGLGSSCHRIAFLGASKGTLSYFFAIFVRHRRFVACTGFIGIYP